MSPGTFLESEEAMAPLKRIAGFTHLNSESQKRLQLDPAPLPEDKTITMYYERTKAMMPNDREKLHVSIPFEDELYEFESMRSEIRELRAELDAQRKTRLTMFVANALVDLARMMVSKYEVERKGDHSTTRLQQFAANVKDNQLQKAKVPPKYWVPLRKLDKYIEARNEQAHETEGGFAQLLLSCKGKDQDMFERWKDIFPLVYGQSVEALAAKRNDEENKMLLGYP